ncbi:transporter [Pseudonocardia adelaidensis]|uniref:TRAP transporter large permease subunit n=1 Tax=Pseudonocardia adelaidensis TaxID=648754 RepID=A0ABP9P5P2_9PSEU
MGIAILLVMAVGVGVMLTRKVPTAFVLVLLSVVIGLMAGAPLMGEKNSITTTVLQGGAVALAATMAAIVIGSWLGSIMGETGIASTLIRKTVELGGDRPYVVALGVFVVGIMVGTVTGSAPAAMLVGIIGIPTMIAMGVPPITAAGTVVFGMCAGIPFELISWQYLSQTLEIPVDTVRDFQLTLFPIVLVIGIAYVVIESRRRGVQHAWAAIAPERASRRRTGEAPWYSLITPLVPIVLALLLDVPIIPALLVGVCYALVTTTRPNRLAVVGLKTLHRSFDTAVPPLLLFAAIGILLAAVKLPGSVEALRPIVTAVIPTNPVLFVVILGALTPLCLYRGPFNVYGMGAGLAGVLIASGAYAPQAVLGVMASYNQTLGVSDPTSTQTVWSAGYAGVRVERVMLQTLPYTWVMAVAGLVLTAVRFL